MSDHTSEVTPLPDGFKRCTTCKQVKTEQDFYLHKKSQTRLSRCIACYSIKAKENYEKNRQGRLDKVNAYRIQNLDEIRKRSKESRDRRRDEINQRQRERHQSHLSDPEYRAKRKESAQKYRLTAPDKIKAAGQRYRAKGLDKVAIHRYEARKRSLPDNFTATNWQSALSYFNGCCAVCGRPLNDLFGTHRASADHWIPLNSPDCPGTVITNIVPLCHGVGGCNSSKQDTEAQMWLIEKFGAKKAKQILERIMNYFEWIKNQ